MVIIIFGPTSSGKTDLSLKVAKYIWGISKIESEFISADSRQVFRDLDIGTNKIPEDLQKKYKHYFIDVADPTEEFTVEDFQREALGIVDDIQKRGRMPIIVGGTGTFIMSLHGDEILKKNPAKASDDLLILVPDFNRQDLYRKIERNVDKMFRQGLYEEIKQIRVKYKKIPRQLRKTLGYKEFVEYAERGQKDITHLSDTDLKKIAWKIKADTKKYAMNQINWLKKLKGYTVVKDFGDVKALLRAFAGRK